MKKWILFLLFFTASIDAIDFKGSDEEILLQAQQHYLDGEKALSVAYQRESFQQSLIKFEYLAKKYHSLDLLYNLANCYYHVQEYPWALLYYWKAKQLAPRDPHLHQNLLKSLERAHIPELEYPNPWFWRVQPSQNELWVILYVFLGLICLVISSMIWKPARRKKQFLSYFLCIQLVTTLYLGYNYYATPVEAIIIKTTRVYMGPGQHFELIEKIPLIPGQKVRIVEIKEEGNWIKIQTSVGIQGYLSHQSIRVI